MRSMLQSSTRLKEDLGAMIESKELALSGLQKGYLRSRWLEQMVQVNRKYNRAFRTYYTLRLITITGCLLLLLLVSLNFGGTGSTLTRSLMLVSSLLVSVCVAVEHLFDFGNSCRWYERVAERLKAEGWRFLQLSGSYRQYKNHAEAFSIFANQVEALSQLDVEVYNFDVVHERRVETEAGESENQKKYDGSPQESTHLVETPLMMHGVVRRHTNPQRTQ